MAKSAELDGWSLFNPSGLNKEQGWSKLNIVVIFLNFKKNA